MKHKTWIVVILLGAVAVNLGVYVGLRTRRSEVSAGRVSSPAPVEAQAPVARPEPAVAPPTTPPADEANEGLSRARRAAGLAALEDGDYDKAVAEFTEALSLRKDKGDLVDLMRIATELKARAHSRKGAPPVPKAVAEPAPARVSAKSKAARQASARAAAREDSPGPEEVRSGLLLVTSTPPGLVVLVDGKTTDLTPARLQLRVGTHKVALAQGDRKLFETTVQLEEDSVQSINRDVSSEVAPPPSRPAPEPPAVATAAPTPAAAPSRPAPQPTVPEPAPEKPAATAIAPVPTPTPAAPAAAGGKGGLEITSPALYGEVWINNRPYGFPPVTAQGIPAGPAKVEIRVNGQVKRKMSVDVTPGQVSAVRVR